jgi:HlyD family secretion protein
MTKTARIVLGLLFAATMGANLVWAVLAIHKEASKSGARPAERASRLSHDAAGNAVLTVDRETRERVALETRALVETTLPSELEAYGRFQEDPAGVFTVRSPIAGVLRLPPGRGWPALGESVADAGVVGLVEPRFTPLDRVDLESKRLAARADIDAGKISVEASRAAYERSKTLNADEKNVSDRQLQEVFAKLKSDEVRLKAAEETAAAVEASLTGGSGATGPRPLAADRGGEVVEVLAQPGEAVESGQALLRVARFDRLIARVALPAGELVPGDVASARIVAIGQEAPPLRGVRVASAAAADPQLLGETFLFRVEPGGARLRPGMALTAYLVLPGEARKGVLLPRSSLVRREGALWAYVQAGPDRFVRRAVRSARPSGEGHFVTDGFAAGESVVVAGAQLLLSEELRVKIKVEEEGK